MYFIVLISYYFYCFFNHFVHFFFDNYDLLRMTSVTWAYKYTYNQI